MNANDYRGGENFDIRSVFLAGRSLGYHERLKFVQQFIDDISTTGGLLYSRCIDSAADRSVTIADNDSNESRPMLMFGSNNYLGLANHPYVKEYVKHVVDTYGAGVGGPPLLNGYSVLHQQLERRLAAFKEGEDALIFSSGYATNVGLLSAILNKHDVVIHDKYCHASFSDGLRMGKAASYSFAHNNVEELETLLRCNTPSRGTLFVAVEGVYSMDGDLAPLDLIVPLCKKYGAVIILDDAHGTGVFGEHGRGTAEYFGVQKEIDITVGTFSKALGVVGGFVSGSKELITYLRYFSRSYMFSASLPPPVIGAVLAALDVMEQQPEILRQLQANIAYAKQRLGSIGFFIPTDSPIICLKTPPEMDIHAAAAQFNRLGIFVNSIEYPAVPADQQRFRISLMATHTNEDIDELVRCVDTVWQTQGLSKSDVWPESELVLQ